MGRARYHNPEDDIDLRQRAISLHEAQFGEKENYDANQLSLEQLRSDRDQAKLLQSLVAERIKLEQEYRKNIAGAALAESLSNLDVKDEKFGQKWAGAIAKYSEGADTRAAQEIMTMQRESYNLYQQGQKQHNTAIFEAEVKDRAARVLKSDSVPSKLKTALFTTNDPNDPNNPAKATGVSMPVLEQAEQMMSKSGDVNKAKEAFYQNVAKKSGLTAADLNLINTKQPYNPNTPGTVQYQDGAGKPVDYATALTSSHSTPYFATATLPNGKTLPPIATHDFLSTMATHQNFQAGEQQQAPPGGQSAAVAGATGDTAKVNALLEHFRMIGAQSQANTAATPQPNATTPTAAAAPQTDTTGGVPGAAGGGSGAIAALISQFRKAPNAGEQPQATGTAEESGEDGETGN